MDDRFMKERPVFPLLISMALPMVISMLVNSLYNIVDSYFVARISEDAMTALSLVYPVQNFINAVAIGFGVGINAQTVYFAMTEIKAGTGDSFGLTVGGNPVNCAVRLIGVPGTIFDDGIIRFSSYNEGKTAHNFLRRILRRTDIIIAIGNIFQDVC